MCGEDSPASPAEQATRGPPRPRVFALDLFYLTFEPEGSSARGVSCTETATLRSSRRRCSIPERRSWRFSPASDPPSSASCSRDLHADGLPRRAGGRQTRWRVENRNARAPSISTTSSNSCPTACLGTVTSTLSATAPRAAARAKNRHGAERRTNRHHLGALGAAHARPLTMTAPTTRTHHHGA